jgi:hypothetical protein
MQFLKNLRGKICRKKHFAFFINKLNLQYCFCLFVSFIRKTFTNKILIQCETVQNMLCKVRLPEYTQQNYQGFHFQNLEVRLQNL